MTEQGSNERRANRPSAVYYDQVRLVTVPRYKTSALSGDEWRYSQALEFVLKGRVIFRTDEWEDLELVRKALHALENKYEDKLCDNQLLLGIGNICDNEACCNEATHVYSIKRLITTDGTDRVLYPLEGDPDHRPLLRKFCTRHSTRGDCGLNDADDNYTLVSGPLPEAPPVQDVSKSAMFILHA